jgi:hypothetical protein
MYVARLRWFLVLLGATLLIAGCGSNSVGGRPCAGLPTAKHPASFHGLFGATPKLTTGFICSHFGPPESVRGLGQGLEGWEYPGKVQLKVRGDRVLAVQHIVHG